MASESSIARSSTHGSTPTVASSGKMKFIFLHDGTSYTDG
ncbi:hypothetical protein NPIL_684101, partial [Nephila pilipes]